MINTIEEKNLVGSLLKQLLKKITSYRLKTVIMFMIISEVFNFIMPKLNIKIHFKVQCLIEHLY
jgi:hypothetical protein